MLAEHTDEEGNDLANSGFDNATVTDEDTVLTDEELLKRDRELELEWLKEDYENLGIVITPSQG
jgi:F420-0:gamma-glutamyl ligase